MIELNNIIRRYDKTLAVDNLSLNIEKGELFGLLGPNGAGKSTLIKMIAGLLKPDAGNIFIDSAELNSKDKFYQAKKIMGLVPQELAIYNNLSAYDNVKFFGSLYGLKGNELKERAMEALDFVGLSDKGQEKPKSFSGGMKRRLNIACAICHKPKIVIFDEPTVGIDPQSRNHILENVRELNKEGVTIIYTSHYMEEVEALCTNVGIMDSGKLIAKGTVNDLKKRMSDDETIFLETDSLNFNISNNLKRLNGVKNVVVNSHGIEIVACNSEKIMQDVFLIMAENSIKVKGFKIKENNLESLFLQLTGRKLRD